MRIAMFLRCKPKALNISDYQKKTKVWMQSYNVMAIYCTL